MSKKHCTKNFCVMLHDTIDLTIHVLIHVCVLLKPFGIELRLLALLVKWERNRSELLRGAHSLVCLLVGADIHWKYITFFKISCISRDAVGVFYAQTGNTETVAGKIGEALGIEAADGELEKILLNWMV